MRGAWRRADDPAAGLELQRPYLDAIALELGLHNATLAIAVGASLDPEMTIPAAVYGLFMWVTGGSFAWLMARRNGDPAPLAANT